MFYLILTMQGEGEQRILKRRDPTTPQSVERKRLACFLNCQRKIRFFDSVTMEM